MKQMDMTRPIDTDPSIFGAMELSSNCKASVTDLSKSVDVGLKSSAIYF